MKKLVALVLSVIFMMSIMTGCVKKPEGGGGGNGSFGVGGEFPENPGQMETIKIYLLKSADVVGLDAVLEEFNSKYSAKLGLKLEFKFDTDSEYIQKINLDLAAGTMDSDAIFDASWINLVDFSKKGYYYDLQPEFTNPLNPGLVKAFDINYINANKTAGKMYSVPLTETYGEMAVTYLRKDWRERASKDTSWVKPAVIAGNTATAASLADGVDNHDEFMYYIYWVRDNRGAKWTVDGKKYEIPSNAFPYAVDKNGGYGPYDLVSGSKKPSLKAQDYFDAGIKTDMLLAPGALFGTAYIKNGEVKASALDYERTDAAKGKKDYPDGFNAATSEWQDYYNEVRSWKQNGLISNTVATDEGSQARFTNGNAGVIMQGLSNFNTIESSLKGSVANAELEIYVQDKAMREKEKGTVATDFKVWNNLCIPKTTSETKKNKIITFLNWLYYSQENFDLFRYGIKGTHWDEAEDPATGAKIPGTVTTLIPNVQSFNYPFYELAYSAKYVRSVYASDPKVYEYSQYAYSIERYVPKLYVDFVFDPTRTPALETALKTADLKTEFERSTSFKLGLIDNPVAAWNAIVTNRENNTSLQNALNIIREEVILQLQTYIDTL